MEGWVDLGSLIAVQPGIEPTTAWLQVRRANRYATESPEYLQFHTVSWQRLDCKVNRYGIQIWHCPRHTFYGFADKKTNECDHQILITTYNLK